MAFLIRKLHAALYIVRGLKYFNEGTIWLSRRTKCAIIIDSELLKYEHNFLSITSRIPPTINRNPQLVLFRIFIEQSRSKKQLNSVLKFELTLFWVEKEKGNYYCRTFNTHCDVQLFHQLISGAWIFLIELKVSTNFRLIINKNVSLRTSQILTFCRQTNFAQFMFMPFSLRGKIHINSTTLFRMITHFCLS